MEKAREVNREIAKYVDVMIGNEEDFTAALGIEVEGVDENLTTLRLPLKEAVAYIERGDWEDGKTVFAILKTYLRKRGL